MRRINFRRRTTLGLPAAAGIAAFAAAMMGGVGPSLASATTGDNVLASTGVAGTVAAVSPSPAACDRMPWEAKVQGAPASFSGGDRGGVYLWHSTTGFHLRVTHRTDERVVYSGVLTSSAPMTMDPVKLEKGDVAKLSADHRSLVFAFANHGHIDGVNFHTECAGHLTVSRLNSGNDRLPAGRVYLGARSLHPGQVPFVVHRMV
jgi:hypothetical protein